MDDKTWMTKNMDDKNMDGKNMDALFADNW